jgi:hypothetical protein
MLACALLGLPSLYCYIGIERGQQTTANVVSIAISTHGVLIEIRVLGAGRVPLVNMFAFQMVLHT